MASASTLDRSAATAASFSGMHVVHQQQQQLQSFEHRARYDSTVSMDMSRDDDDSSLNSASSGSSSGSSSSSGSYDSSDFDDDSSFWSSSSLCSDFSMLSATAADKSNKNTTTSPTGIPTSVKHILQNHHRPAPRVLAGTKPQYQNSTPALVAMHQLPYQLPSSQHQQQQQPRQKRGANQISGAATNVKVSSLLPSTFIDRLKRAVEEEQAAVKPSAAMTTPKAVSKSHQATTVAVQVSPSSSSGSVQQIEAVATAANDNVHPHEYYLSLLRRHHNIPQELAKPVRSMDIAGKGARGNQNTAATSSSFFIQLGEENIKAYTLEKMDATRTDDVLKLQECYASPRNETIHVCNRYGESIIHTACRRNAMKCLQYLISTYRNSDNNNKSILQVMDDYGRNPLHDAFWTASPNYDIVKLVVSICPDLLILQDVRGFCPLHYVRKEYWSSWKSFLNENIDLLRPKQLL